MRVTYKDKALRYKKIAQRPIVKKERLFGLKKPCVLPKDHPWRHFKINPYKSNSLQQQKELVMA